MRRLLPLALFAAACMKPANLAESYAAVVADLEATKIDEYAQECAPLELALANAHKEFAELEFEQGDARRAEQHLALAVTNAREAVALADACRPHDRDGDGILDEVDQCPDEPESFNGVADEDGCPEVDSDSDGIFDVTDQCRLDPEDMDGFQDEDGCPDKDNDGDGLLDAVDACPNEAENFNGYQDEDGCPEGTIDRDGDGIRDDIDQCPDEPENINEYLDEDGCPDVKPQSVKITREKIEITEKILFQTARSTIKPVSYGILDSVAQVMKDYPNIKVRVEGHTDSDGSDSYNLKLSQSRAAAVHEYLVAKGISGSRLTSEGYGEARPIDTNRTSSGKANNRRVEFHITEWGE